MSFCAWTLIWGNGQCANPPGDWQIVVHECGVDGWVYEASLISRADIGWDTVHARHRQDGYPAERAAQLAVEAFLWRNGVLPLPEWEAARDFAAEWIEHLFALGDISASVVRAPNGKSVAWEVTTAQGDVITGRRLRIADAKAAAERHLRCEIAAALDAEAAKEGK